MGWWFGEIWKVMPILNCVSWVHIFVSNSPNHLCVYMRLNMEKVFYWKLLTINMFSLEVLCSTKQKHRRVGWGGGVRDGSENSGKLWQPSNVSFRFVYLSSILPTVLVFSWGYVNIEKLLCCLNGKLPTINIFSLPSWMCSSLSLHTLGLHTPYLMEEKTHSSHWPCLITCIPCKIVDSLTFSLTSP